MFSLQLLEFLGINHMHLTQEKSLNPEFALLKHVT